MTKKTFVNPFDGRLIRHSEGTSGGGGIVSSFEKERFSTTIGQSVYTLSATPISNSEIVARNGQVLDEGVGEDYTISGAVLTLNPNVAATIAAGEKISVSYAK